MSSYPIRHKHEENYKETSCDRDSSSGRDEMRTWDGWRKVLYEEGDTAALSTVVWDYGATTMEAEAEGLLSVHLISSEALNFRHQDPFVGSGTTALESNCPRLSLAWRRTEKWIIIKTEFRKRFTLIMAAIGSMDKFLLSMSPLMREGEYCFLRLRSGLSGRRCRDYSDGKNTYYHVISCWSSLRSISPSEMTQGRLRNTYQVPIW